MKEEILNCLNDKKNGGNYKQLLAFCKEPKEYKEIEKGKIKGDLFKNIVALQRAQGLAFASGKYFATPLALEVLQSIFP